MPTKSSSLFINIIPYLVVLIISILIFIFWLIYSLPRNERNINSGFSVCTASTGEEDCSKTIPEITFNWQFNPIGKLSGQAFSAIEIDNNSDFSSPEYASGETPNNENFFVISNGNFLPGTSYYWRLKLSNSDGLWSDWAECDGPFTVKNRCSSEK